ncbi:MAG: CBS domain-containing protein [Streptosporangiales bacterium]|nr:CBS domain-containing protein [Streptosporangiales bacterium]
MRRLTVREVMTADVVTVRPSTPFAQIARLLAERRVSAVPVVDEDGNLQSVVSEADLLSKEEHRDDRPGTHAFFHRARLSRAKAAATDAAQLMTAPAVAIGPDATLVSAAKLMTRRNVKRLPVVDDGRLVGIVSRTDLLRAFLRPDDEIQDEIVDEVFTRILWLHPARIDVDVRDGVVTLSGRLEKRSHIDNAVRLTHRVDGVVDVQSDLTYTVDDTTTDVPVHPTF